MALAERRPTFPDGKRFAFTVIDDTDVATVDNVAPVYRLLEDLGMRTTKTVWAEPWTEGWSAFDGSQTLADDDYATFILDLQRRGFEIAWHGARMESTPRDGTLTGLERFRSTLGSYPRVHANHAYNRDNLYWGEQRIDQPILRWLYARMNGRPRGHYQGAVRDSEYWWGDVCADRIDYARNLTFDEINLLRVNPSMPYHDPRRPFVRRWFSAADAEDRAAFELLIAPASQDRLEREGGVCIVATHFGKQFVRGGNVHPRTCRLLERLAARDGWFVPVAELLDHLAAQQPSDALPAQEWRRMQWRWARDLMSRRWRGGWISRVSASTNGSTG